MRRHLHTRNAQMKPDMFAWASYALVRFLMSRECMRIQAYKPRVRVSPTYQSMGYNTGTSRWTHTRGSKPGRADRSGQSASALSLFKVRLTLSTIPEKKSMPGPPSWCPKSTHISLSLSLCFTQVWRFIDLHRSTADQVVQFMDTPACSPSTL